MAKKITNADLKKAIEKQGDGLKEHIESDANVHLEAKGDRALMQASIEALPTKQETAAMIVETVKTTVNGKIDKVSNNIRWMQAIFAVCLAIFAYIAAMTINNSNQIAGVAAAVEGLKPAR